MLFFSTKTKLNDGHVHIYLPCIFLILEYALLWEFHSQFKTLTKKVK